MALRRVLTGDAFFAKIEPYRAIWAIALPPDYASIASRVGTEDVSAQDASTSGRDEERASCANCWGVSVSNAYLNLASARGVVMIRGNDSRASPPTPSLVRMMMSRDAAAARPGGVLLTPTDHRDPVKVTIEDANRLADALRARDPRLRDVPLGFWDGPAERSRKRAPGRRLGQTRRESRRQVSAPSLPRPDPGRAQYLRVTLESSMYLELVNYRRVSVELAPARNIFSPVTIPIV